MSKFFTSKDHVVICLQNQFSQIENIIFSKLHFQKHHTSLLWTCTNIMKQDSCNFTKLKGDNFNLNQPSKLKYLNLSNCKSDLNILEDLLASCHSLEKLALANLPNKANLRISAKMINTICYQNGSTLKSLDLSSCKGLNLESIQTITNNCLELRGKYFCTKVQTVPM